MNSQGSWSSVSSEQPADKAGVTNTPLQQRGPSYNTVNGIDRTQTANDVTAQQHARTAAAASTGLHVSTDGLFDDHHHHGEEYHHDMDEDDEDDAVLIAAPKEKWFSQLFGAGQRGWTVLVHELGVGLFALLLVIVSAILTATCKERCDFLGSHVSTWFQLAAYSTAVSIPGRLIDKLFFALFHLLGELLPLPFLNPVFFYVGAFEGAIARFFWIGLTWTNWNSFVKPSREDLVENAARGLFVFQMLAVLRNLALRLLLRHVLIGSFENAINDALFENLILLGLSKPTHLKPDGTLAVLKDSAYKEMARMHALTDFKRKLDFISKLRFRMYNKQAELVAISRKESVAAFARWAYKQMARLPSTALVHVDIKSTEFITDTLVNSTPKINLPGGDTPLTPPMTNLSVPTAPPDFQRALAKRAALVGIGTARKGGDQDANDEAPDFFIGQSDYLYEGAKATSSPFSLNAPLTSIKSKAADAISSIAGAAKSVTLKRQSSFHKQPSFSGASQTSSIGDPPALDVARQSSAPTGHHHAVSALPILTRGNSMGGRRGNRALSTLTFIPPTPPTGTPGTEPEPDPYAATGAIHSNQALSPQDAPTVVSPAGTSPIVTQRPRRPTSAPRGRTESTFFQPSDINSLPSSRFSTGGDKVDVVAPGAMKKLERLRRPSDTALGDKNTEAAASQPGMLSATHVKKGSNLNLKNMVSVEHTINTLTQQVGKYFADAIRVSLQGGQPAESQPAPGSKPKSQEKKAYPKLSISHFAACLDTQDVDVEKAFALFDSNGDSSVEMKEFVDAVTTMWGHLRELKASLNGQQSVSTAINWLLDVVFWLLFMSAALWIYDVPVVQVFVPLGTVLVSASFAIGNSLSNVVSSLIFVLITKPYNVGDRVTCSGVFNGEETLIVRRIDVLTTTFIRLINKEIIVPNHMLLQQNIENFKRSPPAVIRIDLVVSYLTTAAQLELLRQRLNAYLHTQPLAWKPTSVIRMSALRDQSLVLTVWLQSFYLWQDAPRLFKAIFAMYMHLIAAMRELGISFKAPEQSVKVEGSITTLPGEQRPLSHSGSLQPARSWEAMQSSTGTGVSSKNLK